MYNKRAQICNFPSGFHAQGRPARNESWIYRVWSWEVPEGSVLLPVFWPSIHQNRIFPAHLLDVVGEAKKKKKVHSPVVYLLAFSIMQNLPGFDIDIKACSCLLFSFLHPEAVQLVLLSYYVRCQGNLSSIWAIWGVENTVSHQDPLGRMFSCGLRVSPKIEI